MRLKSLEIKGFKSFADKTVINFDEGITGIIGPNGCGKSNIVDSIRWVIGEQRISNLRSENLESLVFNGSKSRSASGLAEVSLTFENTRNLLPTEFNTVTITRRFYKNGESEYRLNDVTCRLKDIHNLFLDTGVSTDSYAIIELGMVDDIIKDKENSRRKMLEQAAGISIYKTRKKEAKLKLDATEMDLSRIEDLLFEINNQLKALESQARKAEKYHEIKKEYRVVSIELAKASLMGFNVQYKELNDLQNGETDRKHELEAKVAIAEAEVEKDKLGFVEKEKALHDLQLSFNELKQKLNTGENERNLAQQQLKFLTEKEAGLVDFLQKSEGQLTALEDSVVFTQKQTELEKEKLTDIQNDLDEVQKTMHEKRQVYDEKRSELDGSRNELQLVQRKQFESEKTVAVADTSIVNLQRSIYQLQEEQEQRNQQISKEQRIREDKETELTDKKNFLEDLNSQHLQTKEQIMAGQGELEQLRSTLVDENRKLDRERNEYELLKSLIDNMEGYPDSVKFLHNNPNWNHHAPVLSDIIYVKEEFRAAVENVLEPYLNYYVVGDLQEGMQAVNLLEANQKGKANFFMLDKINAYAEQETNTHELTGAIKATEVIEIDVRYKNLAKYLLGNVYIAQNDAALENSNGHVVLEKSGKFVKGKFALTGGSVGLFEGKKIGRAKNLEKLQAEIVTQEAIVDDLKQSISRKHAEVLGFNEQLKENAIKETEQQILTLTNEVLQHKIK